VKLEILSSVVLPMRNGNELWLLSLSAPASWTNQTLAAGRTFVCIFVYWALYLDY
jgi:hypothetical protein